MPAQTTGRVYNAATQVAKEQGLPDISPPAGGAGGELVSVVITTRNDFSTVETAVRSVLDQSYPHLEVVVVDDASSDGTLEIMRRLAQRETRIRTFPLLEPRGESWARNLGMLMANGRFLTFQAPNSTAQPNRIADQLGAIHAQPCSVASTTGIDGDDDTDTADNGATTLLIDKEAVIRKIGYHSSDGRSSLTVYRDRLESTFGLRAIAHATNSSRPKQPVTSAIRPTHLEPSESDYHTIARPLHRLRDPVTVSVASMPSRTHGLERVVNSLLPQVDRFLVHLNGYGAVPGFLGHPRIKVTTSDDYGDLRDNGKFFQEVHDGYHFTVDDDINYPSDYVDRTVAKLQQYAHSAIVGYHGIRIPPDPERYFSPERRTFHFSSELATDRLVHALGTGTIAYHTSLLSITASRFATTGMADLWVATWAKKMRIPMIAVARPSGYLTPIDEIDQSTSVYLEYLDDDSTQTLLVRQHSPWPLAVLPRIGDLEDFISGERKGSSR